MSKPTNAQRIGWLKDARKPYLEFLRNLTPQVFLGSFAFSVLTKLDFQRLSIAKSALLICVLAVLFVAAAFAAVANSLVFYEAVFGDLAKWWADRTAQLRNTALTGLPLGKAFGGAVWRERGFEHLTLVACLLGFQCMVAVVFYLSVAPSLASLRVVGH